MFSDFFNTWPGDSRRQSVPAVNISETDENFRIEVAAPGMNKEDFKISVENDLLTISAEKKEEKSDKNERFTRQEFSYVSFSRSFNMPEMVDTEKINASYNNGVMVIILPKQEEAKPKPVREIKIA
ncbi:MAG: Hsp20/alpha crystallin family protein [Bacteroidia bacterium]|nr:Hsp20/alpha crystallin family protein [Bacteroidia bacterium]